MIRITVSRILTKDPATRRELTLYGYFGLPAMPIPVKHKSLAMVAQSVKNEVNYLNGDGEEAQIFLQDKITLVDYPGLPLEWCFPLSEGERAEWEKLTNS